MTTNGDQSRHEGETYAQWMSRLYPGTKHLREADGRYALKYKTTASYQEADKVNKWSFRVPHDMQTVANQYMRDHDMSVSTYLKVAIHHFQTSKQNG